VSVALGMQHAMHMHPIFSGPVSSTVFFHFIS